MKPSSPTSPPLRRPKRRRRFGQIALLVAALVFVAGEATVRLVEPTAEMRAAYRWTVDTHLYDLTPDEFRARQQAIFQARRQQGQERGQTHPELAWTYNPGFQLSLDDTDIHINSLGLRDEEFPLAKPPGEIRILCLGGSTTAGEEVPQQQTYPSQLQRMLREHYPQAALRVINGGIPSYAIRHTLRDFELRLWRLKPDVVAVYQGINDLSYHSTATIEVHRKANFNGQAFAPFVYQGDGDLGNTPTWTEPLRAAAQQSHLARLLVRTWRERGGSSPHAADLEFRPQAIEAFEAYYRALLKQIAAEGALAVPMTFALAYPGQFTANQERRVLASFQIWLEGAPPRLGRQIVDSENAAIRRLAGQCNCPYADLDEAVPRDAEHFVDVCHLTAAGNRLIAQRLAETIRPWLQERLALGTELVHEPGLPAPGNP